MGKKNQSEPEKPQDSKRDGQQADIDRRIEALENSITEIRRTNLEGHKWFTTVMFTLVAVLLTVIGIVSKSDVREAIRDMKTDTHESTKDMTAKIEKAIGEMDRKFAALSGETLKKPSLIVATPRGKLDGQTYEVSGLSHFPPEPLFITNDGEKSTEPLSVRFYLSAPINVSVMGVLQDFRSADKEFPVAYYLDLYSSVARSVGISIAAKETWSFENNLLPNVSPVMTNIIACKMQIFYGAEKPFEARFTMKWMP